MRLSNLRDFFSTSLGLFKKRDDPQLELPLYPKKHDNPGEEQKVKEVIPPELVRSELNLEQNSVFTVSTYREKSREVSRTIKMSDGRTLERKVTVGRTSTGIEVGVLTTTHFKLYLVLLELWEKAGRPIHEPVHFTTLRVTRRLNLQDGGGNYDTITKAFGSLRDIPVRFTDSFGTKDGTFKSIAPFSVLSYLHFYERTYRTKSGTKKVRGYGDFRFDDHILMSLLDNYSHPLRLDIITQFKKHRDLAILLYTYLDRQLAFKRKFQVELTKLFDHLDLSQGYIQYPSQRKAKIVPVLDELRGKELSTGRLSYCEVEDGENDYKLVCRKTGITQIPESEAKPTPEDLERYTTLSLDELLRKKNNEIS